MWVFPLITLAFLVAIPLFVWDATSAILSSTDGDFGEVVTDPSEPGYLTYVMATPSHLSLSVDVDGNLSMATIIALGPNDEGGSILILNPNTKLDSEKTIASIFATGGAEQLERSLKDYLAIGFTTSNTMSAATWDAYVAPVSPLSIDLNIETYKRLVEQDFSQGNTECCLFEGAIELQSENVGQYIKASEGPSGKLRQLRQELFWQTWIEILSSEVDASSLPGEIGSGFGRMVWGLSRGNLVVVQVEQFIEPSGVHIEAEVIRDAVLEMIPFPQPSSPGSRTTVRLLDGVGSLDLAGDYSAGLVRAGAQILIIGNTLEFGNPTELIYHDDKDADLVKKFQEVLGGGEIIFEPLTDAAVEVTVIVGSDLTDRN
ncbi:MAG: hypothetical protein CL522_02660 [Actinobacteria bacterium]|nr:hypothetical protein [Actinomycetota bacterium]|tara:strand:- start:459 stop:1577 length:1119 start_codon:yes stop_codon:yes gene_type:complete